MMEAKQTCSESVHDGRWGSHSCAKPVKVLRDGMPYCTIHDPERRKAIYTSKCYHRVYGAYCGLPAVEVDRIGCGRCAKHTDAFLDAQQRLHAAAPALVAALRDIQEVVYEQGQMKAWHIANAALALVKP